MNHDTRALSTGNAPFTWPPRAPISTADAPGAINNDPGAAPIPPAQRSPWRERIRACLAEIEEAWLDPIAQPLSKRAASLGWLPDSFERYCDRCGATIGPHDSDEFGCSECRSSRPPWDRIVRLGEYTDPLAAWICEVKFTRFRAFGLELGALLGRRLREAGAAAGAQRGCIVPMPTTFLRKCERGIDHAGVIAAGVSHELGWPLRRLLRRKHRPSQRAVAPSARPANVSGAFGSARWRRPSAGTIILVDDVMTTGSTMRAACRSLRVSVPKGTGVQIWGAVLAVTPHTGE